MPDFSHDVDAGDPGCQTRSWFTDADGDGHGAGAAISSCTQPVNTVASADDCDDQSFARHPGAAETCDALDTDCNATTDGCPSQCVAVRRPPPDDQRLYLFCANPLSWVDAATQCDTIGATLLRINSASENSFVRTTSTAMFGALPIHIGANDRIAEATWLWPDGTSFYIEGVPIVGYINWAASEPNDDGGAEDCGVMLADGTWNDDVCAELKPSVCRK
ncbi:MAG: lectin-like protein [Kofleriaceae bacterium]